MCYKRGILSRKAFIFYIFAVRPLLQKVGCGGSRYGVISFSARSRVAASRVHPTMASDLVGRSRAA